MKRTKLRHSHVTGSCLNFLSTIDDLVDDLFLDWEIFLRRAKTIVKVRHISIPTTAEFYSHSTLFLRDNVGQTEILKHDDERTHVVSNDSFSSSSSSLRTDFDDHLLIHQTQLQLELIFFNSSHQIVDLQLEEGNQIWIWRVSCFIMVSGVEDRSELQLCNNRHIGKPSARTLQTCFKIFSMSTEWHEQAMFRYFLYM